MTTKTKGILLMAPFVVCVGALAVTCCVLAPLYMMWAAFIFCAAGVAVMANYGWQKLNPPRQPGWGKVAQPPQEAMQKPRSSVQQMNGGHEITEGMVSKGGINKRPTTPRPAPPKGQGGGLCS